MVTNRVACVYRMWAKDGSLLYVGCSIRMFERIPQHVSNRVCTELIAKITIDWFRTQTEALEAEAIAISTENPLWNVHFNRHKNGGKTWAEPQTEAV